MAPTAVAATAAASRRTPAPTGSPRRAGRRASQKAIAGPIRRRARARPASSRVGDYLGVGSDNIITVITPERVVIGGGVAAAADLLLDTIRDEVRRHVFTTSLDEVEIVAAELGTWAGAIGAAIHGAEQAA